MFVKNGGIILEHHKVEQIQPSGVVNVLTSKGVLCAPKVVITAGVYACVCVCVVFHTALSLSGEYAIISTSPPQ